MKIKLAASVLVIVCTIVCSVHIHAQSRFSVVITEIMADPTPTVGLPAAEWLELRNASAATINLQGFRLQKPGNNPSGPMPFFLLAPDSSVVVCTGSQVPNLAVFGATIAVTSFPSLANDADEIILLSPTGSAMHAIAYSRTWYNNAVKAEGGWTLEMIDPKNPCNGSNNWAASIHPSGGTPGQTNSRHGANADTRAPRMQWAMASSVLQVQLVFNEPMDSAKAANANAYRISNGIAVQQAAPLPPFFNRISLTLSAPLSQSTIYTVDADNRITDCSGNAIDNGFSRTSLGLFATPDSNDLVINEILFNPKSPGVDYVELYNRSNKIFNARQLLLANRDASQQVANFSSLSNDSIPIFPQQYWVICSNPALVMQQYTVLQPAWLLPLPSSMPSYPDDKGNVVLLRHTGEIIDEVAYDDKWHFALADNTEGIALERIDYSAASNKKDNWTSAASTAGFGTPTSKNSQVKNSNNAEAAISIQPKLFSPDNDGFEDFALISFRFAQPGYVANITILDAAGRPVRLLQRNTTCGISGSFRWDGLNDKQQKVPIGTYIVYTEIFNLEGKKQAFKNTVAVARKF
jgi:Lamin Tail Domain/Bacterial Ig-like domain